MTLDVSEKPVRIITLTREPEQTAIVGTKGCLKIQGQDHWFSTLELDWKDNQRDISCIPDGRTYKIIPRTFGDYFKAYKRRWGHNHSIEIADVPDRTNVLIHTGNDVGDTRGCVLIGNASYIANGEHHVSVSRNAYEVFYTMLDFSNFTYVLKVETKVPHDHKDEAEFSKEERKTMEEL